MVCPSKLRGNFSFPPRKFAAVVERLGLLGNEEDETPERVSVGKANADESRKTQNNTETKEIK